MIIYSVVISLNSPETHPTWLPIFTACQPLKALVTYRFLDESFVKSLAFMLTEEMDNCAEDYRQTDQHPIAAMSSEPYEVPSAYSLPDRMTEYYAFLQAGNVHPLIKAAVRQEAPISRYFAGFSR